FQDRPHLDAIYAAHGSRLVVRASRQVEKSTLLGNRIAYASALMPGRQILFISPRREQASLFAKTKLHPIIQQSPILRRLLWPHERNMPIHEIAFKNGSTVFVRSAFHSADGARGIS